MYRFRYLISNRLTNFTRFNAPKRLYSKEKLSTKTNPDTENVLNDGPIKYSKSPASAWKAETSRTGIITERLWYEPYVLIVSLTVFLIYFTLLREENDIDGELNKSLYSRISGLEESQLRLSLEYNEQQGLETQSILNRLKEIEEEKKKL